ncbi:uncharacterized protein EHS24_004016 [Apiotrichum porosum]|uniref:Myb-like domain-containing protein n=1 Tax=Apiotrichum porosum TaxID=105984 RepID=A0A427Y416_9TREE|nr:uncharacterized protein EHS24_004016 [Apiotrichum porosum]RSH85836.1 hypothetical protein EHS24_004016 [Apiotrichum porosum]
MLGKLKSGLLNLRTLVGASSTFAWTDLEELALIAHVSTFLDEHGQKLDKAWASPALWTAIPTRKANACKQRWVQLHGIFVTARTLLAWDGFSWVNGHITAASSQVLAAAQKTMAFNYSHIRRLSPARYTQLDGLDLSALAQHGRDTSSKLVQKTDGSVERRNNRTLGLSYPSTTIPGLNIVDFSLPGLLAAAKKQGFKHRAAPTRAQLATLLGVSLPLSESQVVTKLRVMAEERGVDSTGDLKQLIARLELAADEVPVWVVPPIHPLLPPPTVLPLPPRC